MFHQELEGWHRGPNIPGEQVPGQFTFVALSIFVFVRFASDVGGMLKEAFSAPASLVSLWRREETNVRSPSHLLKKLMTRCDNKNKVGQQGQGMICLKKGDKDGQTLMTSGHWWDSNDDTTR